MPDEQDTPTPEPTPEDSAAEHETPEQPGADTPEADAQADAQADAEQEDEVGADEAAALAAAMAAINQVQGVADSVDTGSDATPFTSPEFDHADPGGSKREINMLSDVHMDVRIELGRTRMFVEDVLKLGDGAVVELDKLAGDPVDVFVNNRRVARGEVLVLNDLFCVRISEVVDISESED